MRFQLSSEATAASRGDWEKSSMGVGGEDELAGEERPEADPESG